MRKSSAVQVAVNDGDPESAESLAAANNQFEGYCADLATKIADVIGFRYRIVPVRDDKYGAVEETGKWNGMVGELIRHVRSGIRYAETQSPLSSKSAYLLLLSRSRAGSQPTIPQRAKG